MQKNDLKFCCDKFKFDWELPSYKGMNIRIAKFLPEDFFFLSNERLLRFYITSGYLKENKAIPNINIAFCPYCGESLFNFYTSDLYANENKTYFLTD